MSSERKTLIVNAIKEKYKRAIFEETDGCSEADLFRRTKAIKKHFSQLLRSLMLASAFQAMATKHVSGMKALRKLDQEKIGKKFITLITNRNKGH